jgi:hypothetical protein
VSLYVQVCSAYLNAGWIGSCVYDVSCIGTGRILTVVRYVTNTVHLVRKVKVKVSLEQATKAQRGSRGIALLFL